MYPRGRCFTFIPSKDFIDGGIKELRFYLKGDTYMIIHNPNQIGASTRNQQNIYVARKNQLKILKIDHMLFSRLDIDGKPCENDKNYR